MTNLISVLLYILIIGLYLSPVLGDFVYKDFNETTGLTILGDAGTTNCKDEPLVISYQYILWKFKPNSSYFLKNPLY